MGLSRHCFCSRISKKSILKNSLSEDTNQSMDENHRVHIPCIHNRLQDWYILSVYFWVLEILIDFHPKNPEQLLPIFLLIRNNSKKHSYADTLKEVLGSKFISIYSFPQLISDISFLHNLTAAFLPHPHAHTSTLNHGYAFYIYVSLTYITHIPPHCK